MKPYQTYYANNIEEAIDLARQLILMVNMTCSGAKYVNIISRT